MTSVSGNYVSTNYPVSVPKDNPNVFKKFKAGIAGSVAAGAVCTATLFPINSLILKGITKINRSLSKDSVNILNRAGDVILQNSGLANKGTEILRETPRDFKFFMNFANKFLSELNLPKKLTKSIKCLMPPYQFALGRNAAFLTDTNTIIATNKIPLSQFHELGHAMNYNFGKVGNWLQRIRMDLVPANLLKGQKAPLVGLLTLGAVAGIGLVSIFKNKKADNEKPNGIFDRVTTFVKNNSGKLTSLCYLPIVLEEGLATYKGEKAVKNLINSELLKKVKLSNRLGFASYVLLAAATGIATMVASKIRDKIAQPNLNKN